MIPDPLVSLLVAGAAVAAAILLFWPGVGLVPRWRRRPERSARVLGEDALKFLCKRETRGGGAALPALAGGLGVPSATIEPVLLRLEEGGLVRREGGRFLLTPEGRGLALQVIRAHRLWERHLADRTGFGAGEWHEMAERREHRMSPGEVDALAEQLGRPRYDPHGDPIPTASRGIVSSGGDPLTEAPVGVPVRVVHLEDEPESTYVQLVALGLRPGATAVVSESTAERVRFWTGGEEHLLALPLAANVSVVPLRGEEEPEGAPGESLASLRPGESAVVSALSPAGRGPERRRLMDLGILPGTKIAAEMASPGGGLTAYRVREALIALRHEQAVLVHIKRDMGGGR